MADPIYTNFIDQYGLDLGSTLVSKKYMLENYQELLPQNKIPSLWVWGNQTDASGSLGQSATIHTSSPVQVVSRGTNWKQVSVSGLNSAAIKTDGTLWLWGSNARGQLGDNTVVDKSTPVQTISCGTNWKQVALGGTSVYVNTIAIKQDGTLWNWGYNGQGTLGDGTFVYRSSPVQTTAGGTNWVSISAAQGNAAAIKTDGTLWTWGSNAFGCSVRTCSPIQLDSSVRWKQVSIGRYSGAGIKIDGSLWTSGRNSCGELGNGTITCCAAFVGPVCCTCDWKQVSTGSQYVLAIKNNGTLWGWGSGLCFGTTYAANKSFPTQILTGTTNWKQVSADKNGNSSGAIKTDGTLWLWGDNTYGQLGDNTIIDKSSPVQTVINCYSWKQISIGGLHTMAILGSEDF